MSSSKEEEEAESDNRLLPLLVVVEQYERDGFVGPIHVLTRDEAQQAWHAYQAWVSTTFPDGNDKGKVVGNARFKPHLYLPFCRDLAHHPTIVRTVQQLLQTEHVLLWSSDFNVKLPNTAGYFAPHQDSTYAGLEPPAQVLTVWLALSETVTENEGCLSFWPGSHKLGQLPHDEESRSGAGGNNMLSRGQRLAESAQQQLLDTKPVSIALRGGQATVHNFYTVHASGPNRSLTTPRVGLALRYMAATVRQTGAVRESVTLVSGCVPHDVGFDLEPILPSPHPTTSDIARGLRAHAQAMQREAQNYFQSTTDNANNKAYL